MRLTQITEKLNKELHFPFIRVVEQHGISDSVYIVVSLHTAEEWAHGYIENSKYIKAFIFCNTRYETDNTKYELSIATNTTGIKIMQKKNMTGEQVANFVIKQFEKFQKAGV